MMISKLIKFIVGFIGLALAAGISGFIWFIIFNPGEEIRQENIQKILGMESPVFYNDGQQKIGVFFKEAHRQYISFRDIPKDFTNAIVAAEDNSFFTHYGIDFPAILRAFQANIRAGKIVQGGSTITQQTAKNLFKRKDRSYASKLKELLFSFQLEYHYPKEKILEFYANQFYVSGNGHGLGVAARYYFNKSASELDLLECAFIAGSVKRPNYYNPFIKDSVEESRLAQVRAKSRTAYVLKQMYALRMITAEQYRTTTARDISFNKGKMQYSLNCLMDTVKTALNTSEVEEALAQHGIDNVATSGIQIFTTVDKGLQDKALAALRKELSRLDVRLRGYDREETQKIYQGLSYEEDEEIAEGSFLFGRVLDINLADGPSVTVSLGEQKGTGLIEQSGMMELLDSLVKYRGQRWSQADEFDLPLLLEQLKIEDLVYVSIRRYDQEKGHYLLNLEKYPLLQGALLAMQDGVIRAMVGGMENHFFNRAITAKRSMGSIMKPLVYAAALQLGWNTIDSLTNRRDVFIFHDKPYFPRPDHFSPYDQISMNWAGVNSENIATIWLLYHLCDHLTPGQFKDLLANIDLDRRADESYQQYSRRIRDEHGIIANQKALYRAAFRIAVKEIEADLMFAGSFKEYERIKTLHYGADFDKYLEEVELLVGPEYESEALQTLMVEKEVQIRKDILKRNFLQCMKLQKELQHLLRNPDSYGTEEITGCLYYNLQTGKYAYASSALPAEEWQPLNGFDFAVILSRLPVANPDSINEFFNTILIENMLSPATIEMLGSYVEKEYKRLANLNPYSPEVLHNVQDFRITAGLYYLTDLGKTLGIMSKLDPVLSFPLGSNVISPLETAKLYEGLVSGKAILHSSTVANEDLSIIDRIENSDGEVVFQTESTTRRVFAPKTTLAVNHILRNVVRFGTGQTALDYVKLRSNDPEAQKQLAQLNLRMPLLAKTGTANNFTNSAFAGFVPELADTGNGLVIKNGYTIAAYVGFDDNTPMVRSTTHITGASGALPLWGRFANDLLLEKHYGSRLDLVDITFTAAMADGSPAVPLFSPDLGQQVVKVDKGTGLLMPISDDTPDRKASSGSADVLTFGEFKENGDFEPSRDFTPYWQKITSDIY